MKFSDHALLLAGPTKWPRSGSSSFATETFADRRPQVTQLCRLLESICCLLGSQDVPCTRGRIHGESPGINPRVGVLVRDACRQLYHHRGRADRMEQRYGPGGEVPPPVPVGVVARRCAGSAGGATYGGHEIAVSGRTANLEGVLGEG